MAVARGSGRHGLEAEAETQLPCGPESVCLPNCAVSPGLGGVLRFFVNKPLTVDFVLVGLGAGAFGSVPIQRVDCSVVQVPSPQLSGTSLAISLCQVQALQVDRDALVPLLADLLNAPCTPSHHGPGGCHGNQGHPKKLPCRTAEDCVLPPRLSGTPGCGALAVRLPFPPVNPGIVSLFEQLPRGSASMISLALDQSPITFTGALAGVVCGVAVIVPPAAPGAMAALVDLGSVAIVRVPASDPIISTLHTCVCSGSCCCGSDSGCPVPMECRRRTTVQCGRGVLCRPHCAVDPVLVHFFESLRPGQRILVGAAGAPSISVTFEALSCGVVRALDIGGSFRNYISLCSVFAAQVVP